MEAQDKNRKVKKTFVEVQAKYHVDGRIEPYCVFWKDGRRFVIDRILDVRPGHSLKAGGMGLRYTCRIKNKTTYLFLEDNKWFVEEKLD